YRTLYGARRAQPGLHPGHGHGDHLFDIADRHGPRRRSHLRLARSSRKARPMSTLFGDATRRLRANPAAMCATIVTLSMVALAVIGPWFNPNGSDALDWSHVASQPALQSAHWFGTDRLGRDLFARTLEGARVSMAVGLVASAVSLLVGIGYGAIAGYTGGRTDHAMMRIIEILSGLPLIFFVIFLTVVFGRSESLLFLSMGAVGWLTMARI